MTTPNDPYAGHPAPEHGGATEQQPATPPLQPASYGQPQYGPVQPPPSRGLWFAIGAGSMFAVGALAVLGIIGFFAFAFAVWGDDFEEHSEDEYSWYYVDQSSVLNAVEEPCEDMIKAGRDIQPFDEPKRAAVDIKAFAAAAQQVADAIGTVDPDIDSQRWRADWETLAGDLDDYADNLASVGRTAEFSPIVPMGEPPVMFRMAWSSDADCEVPAVVVALDTVHAGTYSDYYD